MNVFVSWRGSDREIKNKLVDALKEQLDPDDIVWDSDRDVDSDPYKEFIEQVRKSQVFIVIISDATMENSYVRNEVHEARQCEMRGELNIILYKITDSELTPEFAAELNHISDANHVARMLGSDAGIQGVVNRTRNLLAKRKKGEPEKPFDVFEPEIKGVNLKHNGAEQGTYFVENSRDEVFEALDAAFEKANVVFASQMSGYGRKSAVRKYAELHEADYKNIIHFHYFSGSIREFFLSGLEFTNVNDRLFDQGKEKDIILRKLELLKKLGKDTLLIVPDVAIDRRDDAFILDVLSEITCRVVFITQTLPKKLQNQFPWVDVGRMEDEYLEEIFYNYYSDVEDEEKEELREPLALFFEYIDGHTKSVEVTAKALADEYGIYPEDIPDILAQVHKGTENELSDRILELITEMFDMNQFDEREKKILLAASITAKIPMDEKFFAGMLKKCGIYDSESLRKLEEKGWLDRNRQARTISVESFLAEVCLKQIPMEEELAGSCLEYLNDEYIAEMMGYKKATAEALTKRLEALFEALGIERIDELFALNRQVMEQLLLTQSREHIERLIRSLRVQIDSHDNSLFREQAHLLVNIHEDSLLAGLAFSNPANRMQGRTLDREFYDMATSMTTAMIENMEEYAEEYGENPYFTVIRNFWDIVLSGDQTRVITEYLNIAENAIEELEGEEYSEDIYWFLANLGRALCQIVLHIPYICVRLSRIVRRFYDITGFASNTEAHVFYSLYANALYRLDDPTAEMMEITYVCISTLRKAEKEFFTSEEEAADHKCGIYYSCCDVLVRHGDADTAKQIYRGMRSEVPVLNATLANSLVHTMESIVNAYMKAGELQEALTFLKEELTDELRADVFRMNGQEEGPAALSKLEELEELMGILESPSVEHSFRDASMEYMDYYRTYGGNVYDKFQMRKYCDIADKASALSYEEKTEEELLALAQKLRKRGEKGERLEKLAPEAFALVSEAGRRTLGYKHHYVQYIGGAAIADGKVAELLNGEGKTYTIILAAFLQFLYGKQVHILDTSEYLAERNYLWMRGTLELLGVKVGYLRENAIQIREYTKMTARCDVIYETARAAILYRLQEEVGEGTRAFRYDAAIIDEADSLLIQNGATPPYGSSRSNEKKTEFEFYETAFAFLKTVRVEEKEHYEYNTGLVTFYPKLYEELELFLGGSLGGFASEYIEKLELAIKTGIIVLYHYKRGIDYIVQGGQIRLEVKRTGELTDFNARFRYFLGKKEGMPWLCRIENLKESKLTNRTIVREFMTNFKWIAGTTATASSYRKELKDLYQLQVVCVPPNIPIRRVDHSPIVFFRKKHKMQYILELIDEKVEKEQPVLIICDSIHESELMSGYLKEMGIEHVLLNAKSAHLEARVLGNAGRMGAVTVATALANRGVDIQLGGNPKEMAKKHLLEAGTNLVLVDRALYSSENHGPVVEEIRKKFDTLCAVYQQQTEAERKLVEEAGGLCVIGTTCFDSLSMEQQMRGRSGRQGSVGESYVFFSMEDECLRELLQDKMAVLDRLCTGLGVEDEILESPMMNKAIFKARQKMQNAQFGQLNNSLEMICHLPARKVILGLREAASSGAKTPEMILKEYAAGTKQNVRTLIGAFEQTFGEEWKTVFVTALKKKTAERWMEYLEDMDKEAASASRIFVNQEKKARDHLVEFSKKAARQKVDAVLEELINMTKK